MMNTKTMEGLIGARTNMELVNTPMRVYKEARRKGDTETMERAMGYAGDFSDKAEEYKARADKGMEEEAKEAREKAKAEQEEAIRKRREEREKLEEKTEENKNAESSTGINTDTVEISEEGKELLKDNINPDKADFNHTDCAETNTEGIRKPLTYTKTGEAALPQQNTNISVSI